MVPAFFYVLMCFEHIEKAPRERVSAALIILGANALAQSTKA